LQGPEPEDAVDPFHRGMQRGALWPPCRCAAGASASCCHTAHILRIASLSLFSICHGIKDSRSGIFWPSLDLHRSCHGLCVEAHDPTNQVFSLHARMGHRAQASMARLSGVTSYSSRLSAFLIGSLFRAYGRVSCQAASPHFVPGIILHR